MCVYVCFDLLSDRSEQLGKHHFFRLGPALGVFGINARKIQGCRIKVGAFKELYLES